MSKLKVLFIAGWYPSKENPVNGIFVREHAKAASIYNDITVIPPITSSNLVRGLYRYFETVEEGIKTVRIECKLSPIPKTNFFIHLWAVIRYLRKLTKEGHKPDIIHAHVYFAGVIAIILGKIYRIPVVITEHWTGFVTGKLTSREKKMVRFGMNRAKIILPVSNHLENLIEFYGIKNRFCVIPNVVNTKIFNPSPFQTHRENEKKRILLVALLTPVKGVPYLLEALSKIQAKRRDFILDIVGDGSNKSEYEKMSTDFGLDNLVKFHGLKSKEETAEFMRQCDFFVLPSLSENLPCVLIEAMASGIPVIATNVGGVKEMVNREVGILIPSRNVNALTEAINHMLDHYQDYSSEEIVRYAKERYSYKVVGKHLDIIYRNIISKGSE